MRIIIWIILSDMLNVCTTIAVQVPIKDDNKQDIDQ